MTTDKARKRAVRSRMEKTGERYAAARRNVVRDRRTDHPCRPGVAEPPVSEEAIVKGTGRGWDDWFRILDAWDATSHTHTEIARYVNGEHGIDGWWSQSVTVGYERARGMRAPNQRPGRASRSASRRPSTCHRWTRGARSSSRSAGRRGSTSGCGCGPGRGRWAASARFDVPSEGTRVNVVFDPKGDDRAVVTVTHVKLADAADVASSSDRMEGTPGAAGRACRAERCSNSALPSVLNPTARTPGAHPA